MDEVAFGRYRLLGLIGEGGMGKVYRAFDPELEREVALKVLPSDLGDQPGFKERFRREARTAARLTQPHIIPIFDSGEAAGHLYLVMPVIEGVDLGTLLKRDGPMDPQRAVHVIEQLAGALHAAHNHNLVHRDVKPSNALVAEQDFVYLIDFGIAHDAAATKLTNTGTTLGTWAYMAPERFMTGVADARADVYALACVLAECLTGRLPFPFDSLPQQMHAHLYQDPPRPSAQRAGIPSRLDEVVARGLAKDPDQRYQTAQELATAARQALIEDRPPAPPTDPAVKPTTPVHSQQPYRFAGEQPTQHAFTAPAPPQYPPYPARPGQPAPAPPVAGGLAAMSRRNWTSTWIGTAVLTAGLVPALLPLAVGYASFWHKLEVVLAVAGVALLIAALSRRGNRQRGLVLLSVVLLSTATSAFLCLMFYLRNYNWFIRGDVYACAVFSGLGMVLLLPLLRGRPASRPTAVTVAGSGAVAVIGAVVEFLIPVEALYGAGACPSSLMSEAFAHACPDYFSADITVSHYVWLNFVIPAAVGIALLLVGVSMLRSARRERRV